MRPWSGQQITWLRDISLGRVAEACGYQRDPGDQNRWRRSGSILSITGRQFYDHLTGTGGGGAIDLVMHARGCEFRDALVWLTKLSPCQQQPRTSVVTNNGVKLPHDNGRKTDHQNTSSPVPPLVDRSWPRVWTYLVGDRLLAPELVAWCHRKHLVGADQRGNAVFITRDANAVPVGAELHGTIPGRPFKGMRRGSRKAQGGFWLAGQEAGPTLLVESAIDALSVATCTECSHFQYIISTAGVATRLPGWVADLVPSETIWCGYDADTAGDQAAALLLQAQPEIQRLRPQGGKDWNACLQVQQDKLMTS